MGEERERALSLCCWRLVISIRGHRERSCEFRTACTCRKPAEVVEGGREPTILKKLWLLLLYYGEGRGYRQGEGPAGDEVTVLPVSGKRTRGCGFFYGSIIKLGILKMLYRIIIFN